MNNNKASKVGSRVASASLKADVAKRLGIMAETTEAPWSAAEGIIAGLNKHGSTLASVGTREGFEDVLTTITPLTNAVELAKKMVRRRQGLLVTPAMQADMREIIAWHAKRCGAALVGKVYQPAYDRKKKQDKEIQQRKFLLDMEEKERKLVAKMEAGMLHRSASSSTAGSRSISTATPSTRSSGSSGSGPSRSTSSKMCSFSRESRGVVYFPRVARVSPGAAFVAAVRPSSRVDPRAAHLSGSGAIRR